MDELKQKTFIVSYPRSGSAWPRFLLANILHPDENIDWTLIDKYVPDINQGNRWKEFLADPNLPVGKNHFIFEPYYHGHKIIYIYRDGRDCAVSYYRKLKFGYESGKDKESRPIYAEKMLQQTFHQFLNTFILGKVEGGTFRSWREHVTFWTSQEPKIGVYKFKKNITPQGFYAANDSLPKVFQPEEGITIQQMRKYSIPNSLLVSYVAQPKDILRIKYENIIENPMVEAKRVVKFLEWDVESEILEKAVHKSTYKIIKKLAPKNGLLPAHSGMSGKWGVWKKFFSKENLDKFWAWAGDVMTQLGYEK